MDMAVKPRAVVIGSGFGGLAAAMRLGGRGYDVTVCEKLDAPGGRAYVFRQDGFTFDAGPTIVTAPFLFEELWEKAGYRFADDVELLPLDPFYRVRFHDGTHFDYSGDMDAMRAEVARFNPDDLPGFEAFMRASSVLYEVGFEQLMCVTFDTMGKMLKAAPALVRTQFYRSVFGMVSRYLRDHKLRQVFSFHPLLIGGNPLNVTAIYALISHLERSHGVHYAMGGTGSIVKGMVRVIEDQGGEIRYETPVREIVVRDGRATGVALRSGETIDADIVVSNADSAATYRYLVPEQHRRRWTNARLDRANYSMSLFVWYFGTRRRYEDVPHHMIMMGPRYQGLLRDIFKHKVLAEDFSLYLHRPTASDPSLAPDGCDAFYVLSPVPNLQAGIDWSTRAEPYRRAISRYLSETVLPDLEDNVISSRMMTPQDFQDRLWSVQGAGFGLQPVFTQTAWFRPHNRSEEIPNLYIVGAGTHPGAGLPGVISSARVLDEVVPDPVRP